MARAGDRILAESERSGQQGRGGVIEQVVAEDPPRYLVRWDDGHVSTISPAAGAVRVVEVAER